MILHVNTIKVNHYGVPDTWVCTRLSGEEHLFTGNRDTCGQKAEAKLGFTGSSVGYDAACKDHLPPYFTFDNDLHDQWQWLQFDRSGKRR